MYIFRQFLKGFKIFLNPIYFMAKEMGILIKIAVLPKGYLIIF